MDTLIGSNWQRLNHATHNKAPVWPSWCKSHFDSIFMNPQPNRTPNTRGAFCQFPFRWIVVNPIGMKNRYALSKNCSPLFCPVVVVGVVFGWGFIKTWLNWLGALLWVVSEPLAIAPNQSVHSWATICTRIIWYTLYFVRNTTCERSPFIFLLLSTAQWVEILSKAAYLFSWQLSEVF